MPCNATSDRLVSRRSASVIDGQMAGDGGFDPLGIAGETRGYRVGSSYIHISRIFIHIYLGIVCVDYSIRIFYRLQYPIFEHLYYSFICVNITDSKGKLYRMRDIELKHARIAMLAAIGWYCTVVYCTVLRVAY